MVGGRLHAALIDYAASALVACDQRSRSSAIIIVRQALERRLAISREGRSMHEGKRSRRVLRETADRRAHCRVQAGIAEQILGGDRRSNDIAFR